MSENLPDRSIHIDGAVNGSLSGSHIVLGSNAEVDGEIVATAVIVHGHFRGQIEAQLVHLRPTCHVEGTIRHHSLRVELGARFDGISQPIQAVAPAAATRTDPAPMPATASAPAGELAPLRA